MNLEAKNALKLNPSGDYFRVAYNAALELYGKAPENTPILPATLRSEVVLGVQQTIEWNILQNTPNIQGVIRTSEQRLQLQDGFFITDIAVMFGNELSAGVRPGSVLLQTWENPAAVAVLPATVGGFGANAPSLIEAYNGVLSMKVDTVEYMSGLDALNFKRVDTAQAGTLLFTASNQAQSYFKPDGAFRQLTPFANITGRSAAKFTLQMPDSTDFTLVASNRVIAVLMLRGLRIANGAMYM